MGNNNSIQNDDLRSVIVKSLFRVVVVVALGFFGINLIKESASDSRFLWIGVVFIAAAVFFLAYSVFLAYREYQQMTLPKTENSQEAEVNNDAIKNYAEDDIDTKSDTDIACDEVVALTVIYDDYISKASLAKEKSSPMEGLFGSKSSPKDSPCHEDFYSALKDKLNSFVDVGISQESAMSVIAYIISSSTIHRKDTLVFPMMYAAIGLIEPLIDKVDASQAMTIADFFESNYSKSDRLPVQERVYKALVIRSREET